MTDGSMDKLMEAYRRGDPEAQKVLLERLESALRSLVRKLIGKGIRNERDSMDVCQSLMLAFHLRALEGKVAFDNEKALLGYLRAMIRNKLANLSDHIKTKKRGGAANKLALDGEGIQLPALDPSASIVAGTAEMRKQLEAELSREELAILEGRLAGRSNAEIADQLGKSPDGIRMTWNRARKRLVDKGILQPGPE